MSTLVQRSPELAELAREGAGLKDPALGSDTGVVLVGL